jgi:hypothetical protein
MEFSLDRRLAALAAFLVFVLAAAGHAQAKPNLGGTWKLNVSKSDFGPFPAPISSTWKVTHEDPALKIEISQTSAQGEFSAELSYTTDGKESTNTMRGAPVKSIVKWDQDALTLDSKFTMGGNDIEIKDRWTVSEDGKALTVKRRFSSSQGELDQTVVYEKQ